MLIENYEQNVAKVHFLKRHVEASGERTLEVGDPPVPLAQRFKETILREMFRQGGKATPN